VSPLINVILPSLFSVFVWPLALEVIGWKTYLINAAWDVVQFAFVAYFWIETKGLTLEQIDIKLEKLNPSQLDGIEGVDPDKNMIYNVGITDVEGDLGLTKVQTRVTTKTE
jgi:hypothetical protein